MWLSQSLYSLWDKNPPIAMASDLVQYRGHSEQATKQIICLFTDCWLVRMLGKWVFGRFPWIFIFYTRNEAHKQYSLLDTIFNYMFYLGPPGKYLCLSPQNLLLVGRQSRPTCNRFSWLVYGYFPGGSSLNKWSNIVSNALCCSWGSFLGKELDFQGNQPKPKQIQVH